MLSLSRSNNTISTLMLYYCIRTSKRNQQQQEQQQRAAAVVAACSSSGNGTSVLTPTMVRAMGESTVSTSISPASEAFEKSSTPIRAFRRQSVCGKSFIKRTANKNAAYDHQRKFSNAGDGRVNRSSVAAVPRKQSSSTVRES